MQNLPPVCLGDLDRRTVICHHKNFCRAANTPHRLYDIRQHRVRQRKTLFRRQNAREALLRISQILDGEQKRAHGPLSTCPLRGAYGLPLAAKATALQEKPPDLLRSPLRRRRAGLCTLLYAPPESARSTESVGETPLALHIRRESRPPLWKYSLPSMCR